MANEKIPMIWPTDATTTISQHFGGNHSGLDIACPTGSMVLAAAKGTIITAQYNYYGYGHCVRIDHGNGIHTLYAHLDHISVKEGQEVAQGQAVATSGASGQVTGPHLHFEVRTNAAISFDAYGMPGTCVNPLLWVSPTIYTGEIISPNSASAQRNSYTSRLEAPDADNLYYRIKTLDGYNPYGAGNFLFRPYAGSVLPNDTAYACGRFNEIGDYGECKYLGKDGREASDFIKYCEEQDLTLSQSPSLGACMVWSGGPYECGHVAIVEEISDDKSSITTSESTWVGKPFVTVKRPSSSPNWGQGAGYKFEGFIYNPAVTYKEGYDVLADVTGFGDAISEALAALRNAINAGLNSASQMDKLSAEAMESFQADVVKTKLGTVSKVRGMNLLSSPTLVESPFIEAKIGDYTFGSYSKVESVNPSGTVTTRNVTYPNFMDSIDITKINGAVNQYTLNMKYQIQAGEDPNLIDKILSTVSNSRKIYLTYGDWSSPSFIYRNEEALITKVTSNVDFAHSCITYTLYCTSAALSLRSKTYEFGSVNAKPSDVIKKLLRNNSYGLADIFYGFKDNADAPFRMIASDDKVVSIKAQNNMDILSYLNYLVSCMISNSNDNSTIQNSIYTLVMKDEVGGDLSGPYFKVVKTDSTSKALTSSDMYEVDVGFPGDTLVTQFSLTNDNSWSILYNYSDKISQDNYVYKIDNNGRMYTETSPNITTSETYKETTAANKTWWTKMTQFPITATLQIKGLLRPAMLMEYVKVNAYFYGQRHISSGLYVITKQQDRLDSNGYRTTLSLLRIAGDEDELYSISQTSTPSGGRGTQFYGDGTNSGFSGGAVGSVSNYAANGAIAAKQAMVR